MISAILIDPRTIIEICWNDSEGSQIELGKFGITCIGAYGEPGQDGAVPWLRVWRGGHIVTRVPASHVQIVYATTDQEKAQAISDQTTKMPEPVKVWLFRDFNTKPWFAGAIDPESRWKEKAEPQLLVSGMMSLDELAAKCFHIFEDDDGVWGVTGAAPSSPVYSATYPTALEAQWAATCLAIKKDGK